MADFDGEGRLDLMVGQHGGPTRLFRNIRGSAGVRVRLKGPAGNPTGVGAVARLRFGERDGPAREIHAGSGFWSQNSVSLVLAAPTAPTAVWVRWAGGREAERPWPGGAQRLEIAAEGVYSK